MVKLKSPAEISEQAERNAVLDYLVTARKAQSKPEMSQAVVAKKLGISQSAVAEFEVRRTDVKLGTLQRYARAIGKRIEIRIIHE